MILNREQLLAQRLAIERVRIPWIKDGQDEVIVQAIPANVIVRVSQIDQSKENVHALVFVNAIIDESGKRVFKDEDLLTVSNSVDISLLKLVFEVAWRISHPSADRLEVIKKIRFSSLATPLARNRLSRIPPPRPPDLAAVG